MKNKRTNTHKRMKRIAHTFIEFLILFFVCIGILYFISKAAGFAPYDSPHFFSLCSCCIAMVSGLLVVYQLAGKKYAEIEENKLHEADFLLRLNQTFIQDPNMTRVESQLEKAWEKGITIVTDEDRQKFINYLVYLEGMAPLILNGVLSLDTIDDLMAYRFFLAVNNKELQTDQLKKYPDYYKGCFKLYKMWEEYRNSHGLEILCEENALSKWESFEEYAS